MSDAAFSGESVDARPKPNLEELQSWALENGLVIEAGVHSDVQPGDPHDDFRSWGLVLTKAEHQSLLKDVNAEYRRRAQAHLGSWRRIALPLITELPWEMVVCHRLAGYALNTHDAISASLDNRQQGANTLPIAQNQLQ